MEGGLYSSSHAFHVPLPFHGAPSTRKASPESFAKSILDPNSPRSNRVARCLHMHVYMPLSNSFAVTLIMNSLTKYFSAHNPLLI